ncbi:MAG TPA: hypothetical protein VGP72_22550 [Planctomycetota bacterium]|jgi:hypothetical protein
MMYRDSAVVKKEAAELIRAIKTQGRKAAATKKSALAFLVRAGICDKKGRLTKWYR